MANKINFRQAFFLGSKSHYAWSNKNQKEFMSNNRKLNRNSTSAGFYNFCGDNNDMTAKELGSEL